MSAAGADHVVLLRNDGSAVAAESGLIKTICIPALPAGVTYTQVAAGYYHTLLLRSDGTVVAVWHSGRGLTLLDVTAVPPSLPGARHSCLLPRPTRIYVQVATCGRHCFFLLQDDGAVVVHGFAGRNFHVPVLPAGTRYTQIAASTCIVDTDFAVLLRSDGNVVFCLDGRRRPDPAQPPALPPGLVYTEVAAAEGRALLITSDGSAVALRVSCADGVRVETVIPDLLPGLRYTQVAGGSRHSVFLRSDGMALATGLNTDGQCDIPTLPEGLTYTHVTAGCWFTVLLRSDGAAIMCGGSELPALQLPLLDAGQTYVADCFPTLLMLAVYDGGVLRLVTFGGATRWSFRAPPSAFLADVYNQLMADCRAGLLGLAVRRADATLPAGGLLSRASTTDTIAAAWGVRPRRVRGKRSPSAYLAF